MIDITKRILECIPETYYLSRQGIIKSCGYSESTVDITIAYLMDEDCLDQEYFKTVKGRGPAQVAYRRKKC